MVSLIIYISIIACLVIFGSILLALLKRIEQKTWIEILILLIAVIIFLAHISYYWDFFVDDAYISLRYAKNLTEIGSLRFNLSTDRPIEGYSNFLWIIVTSVLFLFPIDQVLAVKILGLILSLINLSLIYWILARRFGDRVYALAGVWMMSLFPPLALWAVGGLETPLYIFTILLAVGYFLKDDKKLWLSGLLFLLPALTRHEGVVLFFIGFFLLVLQSLKGTRDTSGEEREKAIRKMLRDIVTFTLPFVIIYGVYFLWRWHYFGMFLPNTFYAKVKFSFIFIKNKFIKKASVLHYISPLMLLALSNFLSGERSRRFRQMAFFTILTALLSILPYRDWMPGFRYVLPALPLLIIMASISLVRIGRSDKLKFIGALVLMIIVSFYLLTGNIFLRGANVSMCEAQKEVGLWLKDVTPENSSLATYDLGALSYYSEIPMIYDTHAEGILSTHTTQEGYDIDYILDEEPTFFYLVVPMEYRDESELRGLNLLLADDDFMGDYELLRKFPYRDERVICIYGLRERF